MKKISAVFFLSYVSLNLFSQNNINPPPNNLNIQQVNAPNQININVQANSNNDKQVNEPEQNVNDNNAQEQKTDTFCAECEKIKQLKKLQQEKNQHNDFVPSKVRRHRLMIAYHRFAKRMKKIFAHSKKTKPDYSCFNW